MDNIYKTIFDTYKGVMASAVEAEDGIKILSAFGKACKRMNKEGQTGTDIHRCMSKWVTEQTLKAMDKMPMQIKEYAKQMGIWSGNKATLIYGQYREIKPYMESYNSRFGKEKIQYYFDLLDNTESAPLFLFGWNMFYNDYPNSYFNASDEKMIRELISEYSGTLEKKSTEITGSTVYQMAINS